MGSDHEHRMLIPGELVHAGSGATFDNVNPATEEVLGPVADGSAEDGVVRQNGTAGFDQYLEVRSVAWPAG